MYQFMLKDDPGSYMEKRNKRTNVQEQKQNEGDEL